jgi:hypothetical protein
MAETKYEDMTVAELRKQARASGVTGASRMKKAQLVAALENVGNGSAATDRAEQADGRSEASAVGPGSSDSLKYAQEITSTEEEPERPGRSLVTRNHDVIRHWAEERKAVPATIPGTEHDDHLGVLRLDFPGYGGGDLREVSWDEWFANFDKRNLNFIYQEHKTDGTQSNFFRLENPDREDA